MRKNATKIAAMMLSLALTVTSVNVPTTSSAATKVKLNKTKATLYVGGASSKKTTTLKATYKGKKVKATFTSSNSKVAKVAKSTGKVTAVKKGTATITAKYSGKKAKCKVTVKQYVTGITAPETIELKEGEIVDLSKQVTVSPANANNKEVSYVPDESYIAGVNKDGTVLKGVGEGQTVVTIKAKDGSGKKTTVVVKVKAADVKPTDTPPTDDPGTTPAPSDEKEAKEIRMGLDNPFSTDYNNTVLVGTNAFVKAQLIDADGKPVANKEVELTAKRIYPNGTLSTNAEKRISMFGNVSESVKKTDSKGYVTFVFGLDKTTDPVNGKEIDATSSNFVSSFKLTASAVDNSSVKQSMDVKFAALNGNGATSAVTVRNLNDRAYPFLAPGLNATGKTNVAATQGRNKENIQYVASQQVSTTGIDHKVTFNSGLGEWWIQMPGNESGTIEAERIKEEINWSTDKYLTYSDEQKNTANGWVLKGVEASQLQYATVRFSKLRLSKYSRFLVRAYIVADKNNPTAVAPAVAFNPKEINLKESESDLAGPRAENDFSVQIPISANAGYLYVTAQIISKGQVNTDLNEGFTAKNMEGVKNPNALNTVGLATDSIKGLEVKWDRDNDVTYTVDQQFSKNSTGVTKALYDELTIGYGYTDKNTFWYKTPAFPATGNAIITVRDDTGRNVAYFATPTVNRLDAQGNPENVNVLPTNAKDNMYQISEDEAMNTAVGEISQNGNDLVVDSKKSGVTHAVGTIVSNGVIKINEANSRIYTSVHWNPVTNAGVDGGKGTAAAAFVGQNLVIRAQLVDKEQNPVTMSGTPVEFYQGTNPAKIVAGNKFGDASVVKVDDKTNAKGQAELILNSGSIQEVLQIFARSKNTQFDIKYSLGGENVDAPWVDLYWIDANLIFEPGITGGENVVTTNGTPVVKATNINPKVGENWAYEVRVNGERSAISGTSSISEFSGAINVSGLTIQTSLDTGSVGTVTNMNNGKAEATSTKTGLTYIVNALNSNSIGKDVTFTFFKPDWSGSTVVKYAGEGTATLSKKLTLNVNWGNSQPIVKFIIPTGRQADMTGANVKVYVEVKDANGNPLKDNRLVTLEVKGVGGVTGTTSVNATKATAPINSYGIAAFELDRTMGTAVTTAGQTSNLVATVEGLDGVIEQSGVKWINTPADLDITHAEYNDNAKTITLTFNENVSPESVIAKMFDVEYASDGVNYKRQIVKEVKVSGKEVVLSVPYIASPQYDSAFTVKISPALADNGIQYKLVGVDANKLPAKNDPSDYVTLPFTAGEGKHQF